LQTMWNKMMLHQLRSVCLWGWRRISKT